MSRFNSSLNLGLTLDQEPENCQPSTDDQFAEFDSKDTVEGLVNALTNLGHKVKFIGNFNSVLKNLKLLKKLDLVFNLAEGLFGRNRESQVPLILEANEIPFVGSDSLTLAISLDKVMAKKIFISEKIPTPNFLVINSITEIARLKKLKFPYFVKPRWEGSSKGINKNSLVFNRSQLINQVNFINQRYSQPALVEKFIAGREFTVPIIGSGVEAKAYRPMAIAINKNIRLNRQYYEFQYCRSDNLRYQYLEKPDYKLETKLQQLALKAYQSIDCLDFGRVDFRVDFRNRPYILEINPLPALNQLDAFGLLAKSLKLSYSQVINLILQSALKRYHLV